MSNNCLITTLKESVDNPNLRKLGCAYFDIKQVAASDFVENSSWLQINASGPFSIQALDGAYFVDTSFADINDAGKKKTTKDSSGNPNSVIIWLGNSSGRLVITNKYDIFLVRTKDSLTKPHVLTINLDELSYSSGLETLRGYNAVGSIENVAKSGIKFIKFFGDTEVTGSIDAFENITTLTYFHLDKSKLSGTLKNLGKNAALGTKGSVSGQGYITIPTTVISGSIEDFVKTMVNEAGMTSGTTALNCRDTNITFNGAIANTGSDIAWTSDGSTASVTFNGTTITVPL